MSKVDELVINYAIYEDATEYLGTTEVTLPDLEYMTEELSGAGIAGNIDVRLCHRGERHCAGDVHQNVSERTAHHGGGVRRAHSPSHGEHRQGARRVRRQLRQAGVLRRTHHGRLADLGDAGCIRGGVSCHPVAIRVER